MAQLCHWDRLRLNARWTMTQTEVHEYCGADSFRGHLWARAVQRPQPYFVVDGPVQNGCPEAINPAELFRQMSPPLLSYSPPTFLPLTRIPAAQHNPAYCHSGVAFACHTSTP